LASFMDMYKTLGTKKLAESLQPWALSPIEGRKGSNGTNMFGLRHDKTLELLSASSATERQDRVLVHRGWALQDGGKSYGPNFFYNEYNRAPSAFAGVVAKLSTIMIETSLSSAILR
jgi:hypothetical protein